MRLYLPAKGPRPIAKALVACATDFELWAGQDKRDASVLTGVADDAPGTTFD